MADAMPEEAINKFADFRRDEVCDLLPHFCAYKGWEISPSPSAPPTSPPAAMQRAPTAPQQQCENAAPSDAGGGASSQSLLGVGIAIGLIPFAALSLYMLISRRRRATRVAIPASS